MINNTDKKDSVIFSNCGPHFLTNEQRHELQVNAVKVIYRSPYGKDQKTDWTQGQGGSL